MKGPQLLAVSGVVAVVGLVRLKKRLLLLQENQQWRLVLKLGLLSNCMVSFFYYVTVGF